jgi:hypothetical protein
MSTMAEAQAKVLKMLTEGVGVQVTVKKEGLLQVGFADTSTAVYFEFSEQEFDGKAPTQAFVHITSPILREVPESDELYKWVAIIGTGYRIGCVEAFPEENQTVFLRYKYVLLADLLDEDELSTAMWCVLHTANRLDDELKEKFGGKRWIDKE